MSNPAAEAGRPSLATQAIWLALAKVCGYGFTFIFPLLLVRLVDKHQFGLYRQSFLIIATALNVVPLGVAASIYYFFPREPEKRNAVVLNVFVFYLAVGLACFLLLVARPEILVWISGSPEMAAWSGWVGFVIFTWLFSSFVEVLATANAEVQFSTMFIVGAQFTKGLFMLIATLWSASIQALLAAAAMQGLCQSAVLLWYAHSRFAGFWKSWDPQFFRRQLAYAIPLGLAGTTYALFDDLHQYVVGKHFGAERYAVYAVGCFQVPFIGLLRDAIGQLMIARVSYLERHGTARDIIALSVRVTRWLSILYCGVFFLFVVLSREVLLVLYTDRYLESLPILRINLLLLLLGIAMYDPMLRAYASHRFYVLRVRIILLVMLAVTLTTGVSWLGMTGVVAAMVIVHLLERVILIRQVSKLLNASPEDWQALVNPILRVGLAALLSGAVAALVRWFLLDQHPLLILAVCLPVYGACFAAGIWYGGMLEEERPLIQGYVDKARRMLGKV